MAMFYLRFDGSRFDAASKNGKHAQINVPYNEFT